MKAVKHRSTEIQPLIMIKAVFTRLMSDGRTGLRSWPGLPAPGQPWVADGAPMTANGSANIRCSTWTICSGISSSYNTQAPQGTPGASLRAGIPKPMPCRPKSDLAGMEAWNSHLLSAGMECLINQIYRDCQANITKQKNSKKCSGCAPPRHIPIVFPARGSFQGKHSLEMCRAFALACSFFAEVTLGAIARVRSHTHGDLQISVRLRG